MLRIHKTTGGLITGLALALLLPAVAAACPEDHLCVPLEVPAWAGDGVEGDPFKGLDHTGTPPAAPTERRLPPPSAEPGIKRPVPKYDGREEETLSAGEALIWVPRVLLYPVHLVLEYVIRWPIIQGITLAEEHYLLTRVERFFTFSDGDGGLFPTLFFDFGLSPSMGLYFFHDDVLVSDHNITMQLGYWPRSWLHVIVKDSFKVFKDRSGTVASRAEVIYRPDHVYNGLGPNSRQVDERRFRLQQTEVEMSLRAAFSGLHRFTAGLFYRNTKILDGQDPGIAEAGSPWDVTDPLQVPGYGETYNLLQAKMALELDSRSPDRVSRPGSGVRLDLFGSFAIDPGDPELRFVRYGGEAAGFWDITGLNHVLALRLYAELLERVGGAHVPLTERIALGGGEHLRGFLEGRLRGDSAMVATLDYRYPIWSFLDANLFVSVGNAFLGRFDELHFKRMMMNWGLALRTNTSRNVSLDILVALGTNRFDQWEDNFRVDNVRATFGINQGF